jgi:hypothetical protein
MAEAIDKLSISCKKVVILFIVTTVLGGNIARIKGPDKSKRFIEAACTLY